MCIQLPLRLKHYWVSPAIKWHFLCPQSRLTASPVHADEFQWQFPITKPSGKPHILPGFFIIKCGRANTISEGVNQRAASSFAQLKNKQWRCSDASAYCPISRGCHFLLCISNTKENHQTLRGQSRTVERAPHTTKWSFWTGAPKIFMAQSHAVQFCL